MYLNALGCVQVRSAMFVLMHWFNTRFVFLCTIECIIGWQRHLLVAVTHVDVPQELDRAGFLHRIVWGRVVWGQSGAEPAHSAALWSWSLGGFQTLQDVHEGEGGSPSDLNREGEKQYNDHSLFLYLIIAGLLSQH